MSLKWEHETLIPFLKFLNLLKDRKYVFFGIYYFKYIPHNFDIEKTSDMVTCYHFIEFQSIPPGFALMR